MSVATPSIISIQVLLFARYAEVLGHDEVTVALPEPVTVRDVMAHLRTLPGGDRLPPRPLCAVNLAQVPEDTVVRSADEVAVLPPLAGG